MADKGDARIDQELVKALSHPVRVEILEALQGRVASPAELAEEIDENLGVIAYHAKTLLKHGYVELVRSEPRRGTIEHSFGLVARSSPDPGEEPLAGAPGITSTTFEVDDAGWAEIRQIMDKASRLVTRAQARSAERLAGAKGVSIIVGLAAFEAGKRTQPDEEGT
ncbi:MAG: helix-turn-helix domain-containing protein [Solirubrobacterales bacterium]